MHAGGLCQNVDNISIKTEDIRSRFDKDSKNAQIPSVLSCSECKIYFPTGKDYICHNREVHNDDQMTTEPTHCFQTGLNADWHVKSENTAKGSEERGGENPICRKSKDDIVGGKVILDHDKHKCNIFDRHGTVVQEYALDCIACGKFSSQHDFHKNLANFALSMPYKCKACLRKEGTPQIPDAHETRRECIFCLKTLSSFDRLMDHLSIHTGLWKISCVGCARGFNRLSDLKKHPCKNQETQKATRRTLGSNQLKADDKGSLNSMEKDRNIRLKTPSVDKVQENDGGTSEVDGRTEELTIEILVKNGIAVKEEED